jgi:hypothetical protein
MSHMVSKPLTTRPNINSSVEDQGSVNETIPGTMDNRGPSEVLEPTGGDPLHIKWVLFARVREAA